jgi:hypothetical protein
VAPWAVLGCGGLSLWLQPASVLYHPDVFWHQFMVSGFEWMLALFMH